jgi:hypothetical protein
MSQLEPSPRDDGRPREPSRQRSRRNFGPFFADALAWPLGWVVIQPDTVLPAFISHLSGSPQAIALIRGIYSLGIMVPTLFAPALVRRIRYRGPYVVVCGLFERLPILALALVALHLGRSRPTTVLTVFYVCWAIRALSEGCNRPAYTQLIAEGLRPGVRGRLWGYSAGACGLLAVPWSLWASKQLGRMSFPEGYVLLFIVGFIVLTVGLIPLWWVRERIAGRPKAEDQGVGFGLLRLLLVDRDFGRFTAATCVLALADVAAPFYMAHALISLGAPDRYAPLYAGVQTAAGALAGIALGMWVDRAGNRRALLVSGVGGVFVPLVAWLVRDPGAYSGVFALYGAAASCAGMFTYNLLIEIVPAPKAAGYCAAHWAVVEPVRAVVPMLGAILAQRYTPAATFAPAALAYIGWVILIARTREPRHGAP